MPGLTKEQAQSKWKNLRTKYKQYKEKIKTTGISHKQRPPHFSILDTILDDFPSVCPKNCTSLGSLQPGPSEYHCSLSGSLEPCVSLPGPSETVGSLPEPSQEGQLQRDHDYASAPSQPTAWPVKHKKVQIPARQRRFRRQRLRAPKRLQPDTHSQLILDKIEQFIAETKRHHTTLENMLERYVSNSAEKWNALMSKKV